MKEGYLTSKQCIFYINLKYNIKISELRFWIEVQNGSISHAISDGMVVFNYEEAIRVFNPEIHTILPLNEIIAKLVISKYKSLWHKEIVGYFDDDDEPISDREFSLYEMKLLSSKIGYEK